jgi:hypothetical protein
MVDLSQARRSIPSIRHPLAGASLAVLALAAVISCSAYAFATTVITTTLEHKTAIAQCGQRGGHGALAPVALPRPGGPLVAVECRDASGARI